MTDASRNALAARLLALVGVLVAFDLLSDVGSGVELFHVAVEGLAALIALGGAAGFYRFHLAELAESARWRAKAEDLLGGLGSTVERQFDDWLLTPAEREVALLLLKGLSFKEVAAVRDTSERTGREQARGVYKKAGVAGRAELSAFFFEDLLV